LNSWPREHARPKLTTGVLRLLERGDLTIGEMVSDWLKSIPADYDIYAVDYDGDGRRNLVRSVPDLIGSGASFIVSLGWRRGKPRLTEVRAPENLQWHQADMEIQHRHQKVGLRDARHPTSCRFRCRCRWDSPTDDVQWGLYAPRCCDAR
jgi:membrane-bound lytic murein transglycosylase B